MPLQQEQMRQANRDQQIAEAKAKTAEAQERIERAKSNRK